jgi:DNA-binding transcriptional LysR family regulator
MDHLGCLTTFVMVVEKGGFAAAARHLAVAPATVTRQVLTLEDRVGARLLQRTTRRCTLTEAGQAFYERGAKILDDIREADAIVKAYHATSKGTIRLNTSPTLSKDMSAIIAAYVAAHPETCFDVLTTTQMSDLLGDRIDLAIREDSVPESSMIARSLGSIEWAVCASPGYVARHGMPTLLEELAQHNCLVYARDRDSEVWRFMDPGGAMSVRVSGNLRSGDPHAIRTAALSDQGVALLPDTLVSEDLDLGRLVRVVTRYVPYRTPVRAVYPSRRQLSVKVRTFLDFVARELDRLTKVPPDAPAAPGAGSATDAQRHGMHHVRRMKQPPIGERSEGSFPAPHSVIVSLAAARARTGLRSTQIPVGRE